MNSEQFCYWLQGYFDLQEISKRDLDPFQVKEIRKKLGEAIKNAELQRNPTINIPSIRTPGIENPPYTVTCTDETGQFVAGGTGLADADLLAPK